MDFAHLVSTARVFEVERRMIAQNDPLDEAVHPRAKIFSGLPTSSGLPGNSNFWAFLRENSTFLVSLAIPFEVEGRMITQNDPLDEPDRTHPQKNFTATLDSVSRLT